MVEVPPPPAAASWQKSGASADGDVGCVQVARSHEHVWVRDSKNPLGPVLGFTCGGWAAFVAQVQHDEFDSSGFRA